MINGQEGTQTKPVAAPSLDDVLGSNGLPPTLEPKPVEPAKPVDNLNNPNPTPSAQPIPPAKDPFELVVDEPFSNTLRLINTQPADLSDEDKKTIADLFGKFKAEKLDENSNLVDKDGKIVLSKDNFQKYVVEGTVLTDETGNEVNEAGEILRTVEEILEDETVIFPVRKNIEANLGYSLGDKKYEDTIEGITEMAMDAIKIGNTNIVKSWLQSQPKVFDFYKHIATGGTEENFINRQVDYTAVNLKALDDDTKLGYVKEMLIKQGIPNADNMISLIKTAGAEAINTNASQAVLFLDAKQKQERQDLDAAYQLQQEKDKKALETYWNTVTDTVNKGVLGSVKIPETDKKPFLDYLSKPIDKDGNSADMIAADGDSVEFQLMVSFLRYHKADIGKLATFIAREQNASKLRERLENQGKQNVVSGTGTQNTRNTQTATKAPSLEDLNL